MKIDKDRVNEKLLTYILNYEHDSGQHKARVFESTLNITKDNCKILKMQQQTAVALERNEYGQKYKLDFRIENEGKKAKIRSIWIIRDNEDFARLITCYVDI